MKNIKKIMATCIILTLFLFPMSAYAKWWDKFGEPEYGGELKYQTSHMNVSHYDPGTPRGFGGHFCFDSLFNFDWTTDPSIHNYKGEFVTEDYYMGALAESWERADPTTVTVHLRKGVHWQDKAPVNGREFVADDVIYNYDRLLGIGSGFTKPSPFYAASLSSIEKVVKVDDYTVQFKLKTSSSMVIYQVLAAGLGYGNPIRFAAPEVVKQDLAGSPEYAIGTGAWMLDKYTANVSLSYKANKNYYGRDERHPSNKIPYMDSLKVVVIPDMVTSLAAMRTGKIDIIADQRNHPTIQQSMVLAKSNPEIQQTTWPIDGYAVEFRCDKSPFTDIRVRKALQMSIDRKAIAKSHYYDTVDGTPCGLISPISKEWITPYEEWPAELKDEYSYNPVKAKKLLAEAGYPDGFKTNIAATSSDDMELLEIIKAYFNDIGVDMEINAFPDMPTFMTFAEAGKHDQMDFFLTSGIASGGISGALYFRYSSYPRNYTHNNDPEYDAIYNKLAGATTEAEAKKIAKEANQYALAKHWSVSILPGVSPVMWQPWLKGYNGECTGSGGFQFARMWIDQKVKEASQ